MEKESKLHKIASSVVWWLPPEEALKNQTLFLCQLMNYGSFKDIQEAHKTYSKDDFRDALKNAPSGIFREMDWGFWNFWHVYLGFKSVPELPQRKIPDSFQLEPDKHTNKIKIIDKIEEQ